jgi:hypothetical protein
MYLNIQTGKDGMECHAWRRGSSGVLLDKSLGGGDDLMPCPLGANTRRARASFRGVYLQGQAGCLSCLPAVRLLHFQVVSLGRGENGARGSGGLVVQGERRSRAASSHEPLDSFRGW